MNANDPTEAVRSEEITPRIRERFQLPELKPFGGTILHMLLQDIVGNFNPAYEGDTCILKLICYVERQIDNRRVSDEQFRLLCGSTGITLPVNHERPSRAEKRAAATNPITASRLMATPMWNEAGS